MTVPHPPLKSGPTDPAPTQSTGGPDSLCVCYVVARWIPAPEIDDLIPVYRACPIHGDTEDFDEPISHMAFREMLRVNKETKIKKSSKSNRRRF